MKTFHLTIAKVGENLFDGEVISVSFSGVEGVCEVLAEHEAFVSELRIGKIRAKTPDGVTHCFDTPHGGIAEVSRNQATILI